MHSSNDFEKIVFNTFKKIILISLVNQSDFLIIIEKGKIKTTTTPTTTTNNNHKVSVSSERPY